jgi:exopolysaccharide production protein ExoQ
MPPALAALTFWAFILLLIRRDIRKNPDVSAAVWIPITWALIIGSRSISEWIGGVDSVAAGGGAYLDGSPLDRNIYFLLIALGVAVLVKRSASPVTFFAGNIWLSLFLLYALISVGWSEFPLTAFKRWVKVTGHVIMALVVFTERDPAGAWRAVFRRSAYILIPLSVLFIKYYPHLGRYFSFWTGSAANTGVTTDKNMLGAVCLTSGLFFLVFLFVRSDGNTPTSRVDRYAPIIMLVMIGWLLWLANSKTSLVATILGSIVVLATQHGALRRRFSVALLVACCIGITAEMAFNIGDVIITGLGRDTTLTGRTELWETLGEIETNAIIGTGFESFWVGERLDFLWSKYWWRPNQAHNGWYETYLTLGIIGLALQAAIVLACYFKARKQMLIHEPRTVEYAMAQFKLAFVVALVAFNTTDATFKATHFLFFVFFMASLKYSCWETARSPRPAAAETAVHVGLQRAKAAMPGGADMAALAGRAVATNKGTYTGPASARRKGPLKGHAR